MTVTDLMSTALITGHPEDLVDETLFEMKLASIRHLPIINENGKLVGVVSDRDVLLALGRSEDKNVYLKNIMSRSVETIDEDTSARQAVKIMMNRKIGCLPVTGSGGQLVGVVTETDFLRLAQELLSEDDSSDEEDRWS